MRRRQRGITTVEFAIIGALLMITVFGVIEFGRLLWA
ncbi:MAG: pilus assembly protein, partial [Pseudomonadota bacterium]|nr:pilus assembly protein [Pseudomonadota bacterium]